MWSLPAGVAPSKRDSLSSASQSGKSSSTALGWMTAPDRMWAPSSPAFSRSRTRKSSFPASLASCLRRMAAERPAGPVARRTSWLDRLELDEKADHDTKFQDIGGAPPPTMHTSTWSLSRSIVAGSKESSGVAMRRDTLTENSLACVVLLVAAYDCRNIVLRGKNVVIARGHCACGLALTSGVAVLANRPDILAGADMMCGV